jgi:hypothetical protein
VELLHHRFGDLGRIERRKAMMPAGSERLAPDRADWAQAGLVALALFVLYAATAPRTVALEDDGLFILSSYFLGIEHPPGFPLYTLLGKLFTLLPFGSVAYRVHLMSALFGALTCGLLWICVRTLIEGRLPAYVAALGLGLSPVFWSQSLIADVYTFNTFFFLVLVLLGLRASPPSAGSPGNPRLLPWMALLFGLSLSNHWPLMLLVAPAFVVLLWPLRGELLRRAGLLFWLVVLGMLPYAWLVRRSWMDIPISFNGPLETVPEIWYFLSRAGYAGVDQSPTANWLDRVSFLRFLGGQLLLQFAVVGTLLAAAGFVVQWRLLGRRIGAFLALAFLMPTVVLLLLLGFDYDLVTKHVFHVYPLPAYAVAALWMGLGFAWLLRRMPARPARAIAAGAVLLALIAAVGGRSNQLANADWAARYARAVLDSLPRDAVLFVHGDADLPPIAYLHMVENVRPDITLYHAKGLILGNRLFHPLRTPEKEKHVTVAQFIENERSPVTFTVEAFTGYARRDRWLHVEVEKPSSNPGATAIEIPEAAVRFFEQSVLADTEEANAWVNYHRGELRRRYALLLAQRLPLGQAADERSGRHLATLSQGFYGALGLAEGMMANAGGYAAGAVADMLARAADLMPSDVRKVHRSRYFHLRGALRLDLKDRAGAIDDFETALSLWPASDNRAIKALEDLYRESGDEAALKGLQKRVGHRGG